MLAEWSTPAERTPLLAHKPAAEVLQHRAPGISVEAYEDLYQDCWSPVLLGSSLCLAQTSPAPTDASLTATAPSASASSDKPGDFWQRLGAYYRHDWNGTAASGPAPARRGLPSPLSSPPFPSADWSYGGSPTIGEPDTNSYPLQTALNGAKGRVKVYGWVEPTVNGSTAGNAQGARNNPESNDFYPNRLELGQFVVYVERLPDSVQRDHIDWGFHLTSLFGTDYRSTTNKGYFSSQLLDQNRQYGFDPALEYVDVYFPHVAQGLNLRVGRFISIPGIEAQLTPNNYVFSHSLLYSVDPFTDTGVLATIQANQQTVVQFGISASHDVAPWTSDARPSFMGCVSRSSKSENDNSYTCVNGLNDGKYAFNNIQMFDETWYHKFNSSWHMATEVYFMYQRDVPSVNGPIAPEKGTNGANCSPGKATCFAQEYAYVNYVNKQLGPHNYLTLRSDLLNDKKGQRTGYAGKVSEWTFCMESLNRFYDPTSPRDPFRPRVGSPHLQSRHSDQPVHRGQRPRLPLLTAARFASPAGVTFRRASTHARLWPAAG